MLESMEMRLDLDPGAFFDEFYPRVFRFLAASTGAPAADVEDLVQETLLHAWQNRSQFRGDASAATWVLSIARNRARMRRRAMGARIEREKALQALRDIATRELPEDVLRNVETARIVRSALESIDPLYSEVLVRRYCDGLSVRAIAEELGESEKAIESRLTRARQALREALAKGEDNDD